MSKTFTLFMTTSPYSYENTATRVRLAAAAIEKGHRVNLRKDFSRPWVRRMSG